MAEKNVDAEILQSIRIKVDGKAFGRTKLMHLSTIAQLRIELNKNYDLSSNTHFLDNEGYPIARGDEEKDTIELLLQGNNTVQMKTDEIPSTQKTLIHNSNCTRPKEEIDKKIGAFITTGRFSILGRLRRFLSKPLVILPLTLLVLYYIYTKIACRHGSSFPFVTTLCPADLEFVSLPPLSSLANNSASLAETLINTDVSAPMHFVQAKNALIELRAKIIYSDIDINIKSKLGEDMQELKYRIQTGANDLTDALASFGGALDRLRVYVKFGLDDLSKVIDSETQHRNSLLRIGYSGMEQIGKVHTSFLNYMTSMNKEVDEVLIKTQDAQMSLRQIEEELKTIQELIQKGAHTSQSRLDELQHGSYWSQLFDEGKLGIVKHQRNINTLNELASFVIATSNTTGRIIIQLKSFRIGATNLKATTAILNEYPIKSANDHTQLLRAALNRLTQSKETFEEKIEETKRQRQFV